MKQTIDSTQLKSIISDFNSFKPSQLLLSISWGFWNMTASLLCIFNLLRIELAWQGMLGCALLSHIIILLTAKKKQGYELSHDAISKRLWIFISIPIIELTFIFPEITSFYNRDYSLVFPVLLVGIGLCITSLIQKVRFVLVMGITWILTANIIVYKVEYVYHIYAALTFITLIAIPTIMFFLQRNKK